MTSHSEELPGLTVVLDKLVYRSASSPHETTPHAFIYYITIHNHSERTITLLGRKWVLENESGDSLVIEGDKIVGETPRLAPGESFSYNSYHLTAGNARATGSFHGIDEHGNRVHAPIPPFNLVAPQSH
jgi:ApaG protein